MKTRTKVKIALSTVIIIALAFVTYSGVRAVAIPAVANAQAPFDHSGCQYPTRTTNPPNGCDNSDPCDPTNTKGGSGECRPYCAGYPNGVCESCTIPGSCEGKDPTPPDPDRPYYDGAGNKYDYQGNLIEAAPQEDAPVPACQGSK